MQDALQLAPEGVDDAVAPEQRQELVRVLLAQRREAADQRFAREPLSLLDVAEHHRVDALAEHLVGKASERVLPPAEDARLVEHVLDAALHRRSIRHPGPTLIEA